MTARMELRNISRRFGGLQAVADVSFSLQQGEILGVIGPNGAGKTTLFNLIAGIHRPSGGQVFYDGADVTGKSSDAIARLGMARTFQAVHAFKAETVRENLRRAGVLRRSHDPLAHLRHWLRREADGLAAEAEAVAAFTGLSAVVDNRAGGLSYGQQKILGIGMAMMQLPQLVLMDEPAAGLNPSEKQLVAELIRRMRDERQMEVLVVEHDMRLIIGICDRILVINQGRPIAIGTPAVIQADPSVIDAYLGVDYEFA
ncbi:MAG: high-affinity branched-chain amino acid transport ATP-binding protein [Rhodoferax sp.]|nr:high-affinity branched-chain amino acid transport ATP-binding protein [Rhodoferax sp.]